MRFSKNSPFSKLTFIAVSLLALLASPALAEDGAGKFTLTREVHWGPNVLPAGEYTYALQHKASEVLFLRTASGDRSYIVLARSTGAVARDEGDSLLLQRSGDDWFVSSLTLGEMGETLYFAIPAAATASTLRTSKASDTLFSLAKP